MMRATFFVYRLLLSLWQERYYIHTFRRHVELTQKLTAPGGNVNLTSVGATLERVASVTFFDNICHLMFGKRQVISAVCSALLLNCINFGLLVSPSGF
jgi:hypothetical protein